MLTFANSRKMKTIDNNQMLLKCKDVLVHKIDDNTYRVSSSTDKNLFYTTYVDIYYCDCISGRGGCFCKHLCAVQQKLGIVLKSAPCLTLDDKKDFAKIALGDDIPTSFFNNMDTHDSMHENNENEVPDTIGFEQSNAPVSKLASLPEADNMVNDEEHSFAVAEMSQEFQRLANIATTCKSVDMTNTVIKLTKALKNVETPAQLLNFFHSLPLRRQTKIGVQPTSISRRKLRPGLTSGAKRMQAGRPSKQEVVLKRKRARCLQANVNANKPNAKSH